MKTVIIRDIKMAEVKKEVQRSSKEVQSKIRSSISINSYQQCVEELVLNSLDSSATCLAVRVNTNTGFIQVVDNGTGISCKSMKLVGERYTSSKSPSLPKGKRRSSTHGYRGEALASIAYLCRKLQIITRYDTDDDEGETLCKTFEKGKWTLISADEKRPSSGTTVTVCQLFHQSHVQKQMKSASRMMDDIVSKLKALAVVHCTRVSFSCKDDRNGNIVLHTGRVRNVKEAITALYGGDYVCKLRPISGTHDQLQVQGIVSCEAYPSAKLKVISLNKRILKSNRLYPAIDKELKNSLVNIPSKENLNRKYQANERSVKRKRNFFYVINLIYDSELYDIMLDPDKAKVEFQTWDKVIDSLTKLVRRFLFTNNLNKGADNKMLSDSIVDRPSPADVSLSDRSKNHTGTVVLCESDQALSDLVSKEVKGHIQSDAIGWFSGSEGSIKEKFSRKKSFEILAELPQNSTNKRRLLQMSAIKQPAESGEENNRPEPMLQSESILKTAQWIVRNFSEKSEILEACSPHPCDLLVHTPSRGGGISGGGGVSGGADLSEELSLSRDYSITTSVSDVFAPPVFPNLNESPFTRPLEDLPMPFYNNRANCRHISPLPTICERAHPGSAPARLFQRGLKRHLNNKIPFCPTPGKMKKTCCQHRISPSKGLWDAHKIPSTQARAGPWVQNVCRKSATSITPPATSWLPYSYDSSDQLPSYVTPKRCSYLSHLAQCEDTTPGSFASLSPALQKIFAPLRQ